MNDASASKVRRVNEKGLVPPSANAATDVSYATVFATLNTGVRLSKSYDR